MASTTVTDPTEPHSAFFYGTLMAPSVLHRVCHGSTSPDNPLYATHNLKTTPALLPSFRRHRVAGADYPAILPHHNSTVRGTYVTGLTNADIWRLDIFEGSEYSRQKVSVSLLNAEGKEIGEAAVAETYIWIAGEDQLEDGEWDFEEFKREKMRFWVGAEGEGEYAEVDEAVAKENDGTRGRGANGHISHALTEEHKKSAA